MPYRIAVVCLGNICRSPMAAAVLRHKVAEAGLDGEVVVSSAGTGDWHVGGGADRRARAALRARGYSDEHRAQQFIRSHFADHDLVLAMDSANVRDLRRIAPDAETGAAVRLFDVDGDVADPYYGGPQDFESALDQIERAADLLIAELPDLIARGQPRQLHGDRSWNLWPLHSASGPRDAPTRSAAGTSAAPSGRTWTTAAWCS